MRASKKVSIFRLRHCGKVEVSLRPNEAVSDIVEKYIISVSLIRQYAPEFQ